MYNDKADIIYYHLRSTLKLDLQMLTVDASLFT